MGLIVNIIISAIAAIAIMRIGMRLLGGFSTPPPEPPPPGELRRVKIMYRCEICGTEVRVTSAPEQYPEPPRHCMDDMTLLNPTE